MLFVVIDLLYALVTMALGAAAGWWLCSRSKPRAAEAAHDAEARRAHEVLVCLQKLASSVATELGEHSTRVEEINEELVSTNIQEPTKIVNVVAKLVDANKSMQGRLDQAEDRLREQARLAESQAVEARTDALTLVGNRRAFDTEIARLWEEFQRSGENFILAMIDLDRFKKINDTYGHQGGDEVLRGVGRVLRRTLRETDVVARYGGEEFAVIFSKTSIADAQQTAARIRKAVERAVFPFEKLNLQVTVSIGLSQTLTGTEVADVVKRADEGLYVSKSAGRNCVHWHDGQRILPIGVHGELIDPDAVVPPAPLAQPPEPVKPEPVKPEAVKPVSPRPDPLPIDVPTELLNRTAFCQQVRSRVAEWNRGGPVFSLVLIEIDQCEETTRRYGSQARDMEMALLTRLVLATVREMDMVAHYSSSCIACLLPNARLPDAIRVAERIRETALHQAVPVAEGSLKFTVSIGAIELSKRDDMVSLFRRAESALDAGHLHGGNCTYHHDGDRCVPITAMMEVVSYLG